MLLLYAHDLEDSKPIILAHNEHYHTTSGWKRLGGSDDI